MKACHGTRETDAPCFVGPLQQEASFRFRIKLPKPLTSRDQETAQRCGIPAVSGYCTSDHKDIEYGQCKGKEAHRADCGRERERGRER
jgi:hypothetical protein